jgi:hypothetical protein
VSPRFVPTRMCSFRLRCAIIGRVVLALGICTGSLASQQPAVVVPETSYVAALPGSDSLDDVGVRSMFGRILRSAKESPLYRARSTHESPVYRMVYTGTIGGPFILRLQRHGAAWFLVLKRESRSGANNTAGALHWRIDSLLVPDESTKPVVEAARRLAQRQYRDWPCFSLSVTDGGVPFVESLDSAGYHDGRCGRGQGADFVAVAGVARAFGTLGNRYFNQAAAPP